jgi:hypothetical protein
MSFTYDVTTTTGQMRLLIGDTNSAAPNFQDEELSAIQVVVSSLELGWQTVQVGNIPVAGTELLLLCCAQALDSLAAKVAASPAGQTVTLSDYKLTGKDQVQKLQDMAQRFRDAVNNMPAWAIIEENLSAFNEMLLIRNWVLRTEM